MNLRLSRLRANVGSHLNSAVKSLLHYRFTWPITFIAGLCAVFAWKFGAGFILPAAGLALVAICALAIWSLVSIPLRMVSQLLERLYEALGFRKPRNSIPTASLAFAMFAVLAPLARSGLWIALFILASFIIVFAALTLVPSQVRHGNIDASSETIYGEIVPNVVQTVGVALMGTLIAVALSLVYLRQPYAFVIGLSLSAIILYVAYQSLRRQYSWFEPSSVALLERVREGISEPIEGYFVVSLAFALFLIWVLYISNNAELAVPVGGAAALFAGMIGMSASKESWVRDIAPELIGIAVSIVIIDQIYAARAQKEDTQREKSLVIYQLSSPDPDSSREAFKRIKDEGWLYDGSLYGANLRYANLAELDLTGAYLVQSNLAGADLHSSNLTGAMLFAANLNNANLQRAILTGANLQNATLYSANLQSAIIPRAHMQNSLLVDAVLDGADVSETNLRQANMGNASLNYLYFSQNTIWPEGVDFMAAGAIFLYATPTPSLLPSLPPTLNARLLIATPVPQPRRSSAFVETPLAVLSPIAPSNEPVSPLPGPTVGLTLTAAPN